MQFVFLVIVLLPFISVLFGLWQPYFLKDYLLQIVSRMLFVAVVSFLHFFEKVLQILTFLTGLKDKYFAFFGKMSISMMFFLFSSSLVAQVLKEEDKINQLTLVAVIDVPKSKTCGELAKDYRSKSSEVIKKKVEFSKQDCEELLALRRIYPLTDSRNPMMQIKGEATAPAGTQFGFVLLKSGKKGWVLLSNSD